MRRVLTEYTGALFEWTYGCEGIAEIGGVAISMTTPQYERAKAAYDRLEATFLDAEQIMVAELQSKPDVADE